MQQQHSRIPSNRRALAISAGLALAAALLEWLVRPVVGARFPFLFFFPAIGAASMLAGWRHGALVMLGGLVNSILWFEPVGEFHVDVAADQVALGGYVAAGVVLIAMGDSLQKVRQRALDAEQGLRSQILSLRSLHQLNARLLLMPRLDTQLQTVLQALCDSQGAQKGLMTLYDKNLSRLRIAANVGFSDEDLLRLESIPPGKGASGACMLRKQPVIVENTQTDVHFEELRDLPVLAGFRAVHTRPLLSSDGNIFGVVAVHFEAPHRASEPQARLGDLYASMASVFAERETARAEAASSSRKLEVALETSAIPFCLFKPVRDAAGRVTDFRWEYFNKAAAAALHLDTSTMRGKAALEIDPQAWAETGLFARYVHALEADEPVRFEVRSPVNATDGWFSIVASAFDGGLAIWFADITERRQREIDLHRADQRKDEFLATLAHELRNPLAPIRQASQVARSPRATQDQQRWAHEVVERQVTHMALLLDDLLDVARITRGKVELRKTVSGLGTIIQAAVETARPLIESRNQALSISLPDAPLLLDVDAMRMAQVLSNLLGNASKYTQPGGCIALAARREGGDVVVDVSDDGIGIAPHALEEIFEMFTQMPNAGSTSGLGIGLALSRGLVRLHGGTLTAHSEGVGHGSRFTLRMALSAAPTAAATQPPALPGEARARRVLVADDNRDAAESLALLLRTCGHEVSVAYDGGDALEQFNAQAPEVALLDIGMPVMSGNQVASAIRALPQGKSTVLIAITGWGQERDREAARNAGFDYHFTKPVDPERVLDLLNAV